MPRIIQRRCARAPKARAKKWMFYGYFTRKTVKVGSKRAHRDALVKTCQSGALTNMRFLRAPHIIQRRCAREKKLEFLRIFYEKKTLKVVSKRAHRDARVKTRQSDALTNMRFLRTLLNVIQRRCARAPKTRLRKIRDFTDILRKNTRNWLKTCT